MRKTVVVLLAVGCCLVGLFVEVFFFFFPFFSFALFEWCLISLIWKRSSDDYGCVAQVRERTAVMGRGVSALASAKISVKTCTTRHRLADC